YGCGQNFSELWQAERLLELPELEARDDEHPDLLGWTIPTRASRLGALRTSFDENGFAIEGSPTANQPSDSTAEEKASSASEPKRPIPFVFRRSGTGCVAASAANQPFPGQQAEWSWIFNAVSQRHWQRFKRNG